MIALERLWKVEPFRPSICLEHGKANLRYVKNKNQEARNEELHRSTASPTIEEETAMKHMRTLGLLVLLMGFTLSAVGCAASEKTPENEPTPMPTPMVVVTRMTALCIGPLTMVDGCLRTGDSEASNLVVWPPDFEVSVENDTIRVLYDDHEVEVRLGQVVRLGGGEVKSLEAFDERTRQQIPAGCPGPYWLVGSISPVEETEWPGTSADLVGTEWVLISLNGESLIEGTNITLNFAASTEPSRSEGILSGFAGCNAYGGGPDSGPYTATDEGTLTIPRIAVTAQLCLTPEGVIQQEVAYIETLRNAAAYRVMDDRLEIDNAAGETTLVFARKEEFLMNPSHLVGTEWQLLSWNGSSLIEGSTITLAFHDEYRLSGHAGCRGYVATYEASGDDISFHWLAMTGDICTGSEALLEQEGEYTTILGWATDYGLGEGKLEILTARGEVLVFEPLPEGADASLEGTAWALAAFIEEKTVEGMPTPLLMPTDLLAETEITATFEDGTVSGSAGCNTYSAAYTFDGSFFTFEAPAATEMACSDPAGVMEQEQRYLGFLGDITTYHINGNQLRLETGDGRALVFTAQE